MLESVIFALALVAQSPTKADIDFTFAQEAFVASSVDSYAPPKPVREIIQQAGDDQYCARQAASQRLLKVEPRWLMWGCRLDDMEIRLRCNQALRIVSKCRDCQGDGLCRFVPRSPANPEGECRKCHKFNWGHGKVNDWGEPCICPTCGGYGVGWTRSIFDTRTCGQ